MKDNPLIHITSTIYHKDTINNYSNEKIHESNNEKRKRTKEDKKIKATIILLNDNKNKIELNAIIKKCVNKICEINFDNRKDLLAYKYSSVVHLVMGKSLYFQK